MKLLAGLLMVLVACAVDEPSESSTTQAGTSMQGTSMQGTSMQGTSMQGTSMQGTSMQGTSMQGTTFGGTGVSNATVQGTQLVYWTQRSDGNWEQRFPAKLCVWNSTRFFRLSCTSYDLATQPSPIAGSKWPTTFVKHEPGLTTYLHATVQIGLSSTHVGAVTRDTQVAMFDIDGSDATGDLVGCNNPPGKCRKNNDLFLYDLKVLEARDSNGNVASLCPAGQRAMALAGWWAETGEHYDSTSKFMFVCTSGTIAKCTRWGYRPWASAIKHGDATNTLVPLADYHAACIRAAAADYCGTAKSFTKDGTLVDVYDYENDEFPGFVKETRGGIYAWSALHAVVWESQFDKLGAVRIDHARYDELQTTDPNYNIATECGDKFELQSENPGSELFANYLRYGDSVGPMISIASTPSCAHDEWQVGKWLHRSCSDCTWWVSKAMPHCTDPTDPKGWDSDCVAEAGRTWSCTQPDSDIMGGHAECKTGGALNRWTSGCTLLMSQYGYASCFDILNRYAWDASCIAAANALCTGGEEHSSLFGRYGFCNQVLPAATQSTL